MSTSSQRSTTARTKQADTDSRPANNTHAASKKAHSKRPKRSASQPPPSPAQRRMTSNEAFWDLYPCMIATEQRKAAATQRARELKGAQRRVATTALAEAEQEWDEINAEYGELQLRYRRDLPECVALSIMGSLGRKGGGLAAMACRGFRATVAKAQELGKAQWKLGCDYRDGTGGVAKNEAKAVECFVKGAALGSGAAQCNLGHCYSDGIGVARDMVKAVEWYTKAAKQGHVAAQLLLNG